MYQIDNILIDKDIIKSNFSCDLKQCKGACCTYPGDYGAPVLDEEVELIEKSKEAAKKYMSAKSIDILNKVGSIDGEKGDFTTVVIDKKDCVFVFYEADVAKCAIEKAYFNGESEFRKPLSCHLFPIRVGNFGGKYLYYEKIKECKPALIKGNEQNLPMVNELKDSISRAFGSEFYEKLELLVKQETSN
ncbi:MAG: DUF3109 family protein [Candidatus Kapaibacteriota bacterium]|jgi:hypothetical protein